MIGKLLSYVDGAINEKKGFPFPQIHKAIKGLRYLESMINESDNIALSRFYLKIRNGERRLTERPLILVTIDEAVLWTYEWIKSFPCRYDLIVGIPRAGLLIGSVIASKLGVPLSTPDSFSVGIYWSGSRGKTMQNKTFSEILIVDDSVDTGTQIKRAYETIRRCAPDARITRACLMLVSNRSSGGFERHLVDMYFKVVLRPLLLEWEIPDNRQGTTGVDLDGVICEECPLRTDTNERRYLNWLRNAKPYLIPNYEIDFIVSNRLEKYRPETEEWLRKNGVRYRKLLLWNLESKEERQGRYAENKIEILTVIKPDLFIESEDSQAKAIWTATKIPTICTDKMILYS